MNIPNTPLAKAVAAYRKKELARFHMPGHKGREVFPLGKAASWDITEVEGADSLYEASEAIAATEAEYARLYGTAGSFLSAGGSTLCIQAMLALACRPGGQIIAARGVHTAAVNAMALLDLHPQWIWPRPQGEAGMAGGVDAAQVESALARCPQAQAVYLTSPNYLGILSDIEGIGKVCRAYRVPLLVDNAHGAHLRFLEPSLHPMSLGADACCDSLHKSLPVLTGGAVLHIRKKEDWVGRAKGRMALFGSTSPSYPILLSADGALTYLQNCARKDLAAVSERIKDLRVLAAAKGFARPEGALEPARLTLGFGALGYTGPEFGAYLRENGIEPEYVGGRFCVLLASGRNGQEDFHRLEKAIDGAEERPALPLPAQQPPCPEAGCSVRQAVFSAVEEVGVEQAPGRIAGSVVAPCPPGVPLALPGEKITTELADWLKKSGVFRVNVIK